MLAERKATFIPLPWLEKLLNLLEIVESQKVSYPSDQTATRYLDGKQLCCLYECSGMSHALPTHTHTHAHAHSHAHARTHANMRRFYCITDAGVPPHHRPTHILHNLLHNLHTLHNLTHQRGKSFITCSVPTKHSPLRSIRKTTTFTIFFPPPFFY